MVYLSALINKPLFFEGKIFATVVDFGVAENLLTSSIKTIVAKKGRERCMVPISQISYSGSAFYASSLPLTLDSNEKDFYLVEDLLDKQVIDITGKRLVRVNDVLLKETNGLSVIGIDIGLSGIIRRLGLGKLFSLRSITIPWSHIEAFDYQTGTIKIKLTQRSLSSLHPAEIADILEDVGIKERLGVVEALDPQKAAAAIEEANEETQESILDELPKEQLKEIVQKMPASEIADILESLNEDTAKEIFSHIGKEKTNKVKRLLKFAENVAGGLMTVNFHKETADITIKQLLHNLQKINKTPEAIVVTSPSGTLEGVVPIKHIVLRKPSLQLKTIMLKPQYVYPNTPFEEIFRRFSEYNLRILPVVDESKNMLGIIHIDDVLAQIQDEEEREDAI